LDGIWRGLENLAEKSAWPPHYVYIRRFQQACELSLVLLAQTPGSCAFEGLKVLEQC